MKADAAMNFFLTLRNISQKQGPISYVCGGNFDNTLSYQFAASYEVSIPSELIGREIADCCASHLIKLAKLLLSYYQSFPYRSCVAQALTEQGMIALGYSLSDVESFLGLPAGITSLVDFPIEEKLRVLSRDIEPLDINELERICSGNFLYEAVPLNVPHTRGHSLTTDLAALIQKNPASVSQPRVLFLKAIMQRIKDIDKNGP